MASKKVTVVILAGGGGTRLWPVSTEGHPKPLCSFSNDSKSLLEKTMERAEALAPLGNIYIATNAQVAKKIKEQMPGFDASHILIEPMTKDTAAAIGFSVSMLPKACAKDTMVVLTADHEIPDKETFSQTIALAVKAAQRGPYLVTIGIEPKDASTQYGYIKISGDRAKPQSVEEGLEFKEKPDKDTALRFLNEGNYLWNSGIFIWTVDTITEAFKRYMPQLYAGMLEIKNSPADGKSDAADRVFSHLEKISIDYGIMQKVGMNEPFKIRVARGSFLWSDLGNWDSMVVPADDDGNIVIGKTTLKTKDVKNCVIYNESTDSISIVGLKDAVVVNTSSATLITKRNRSSDVKALVESMKKDASLRKYITGELRKNKEQLKSERLLVEAEDNVVFSQDGLIAVLGISGLVAARFHTSVAVSTKEHFQELFGFLAHEEINHLQSALRG